MSQVRFSTISFLSDFGTRDEFVGVVKSVIRSIAPDVAVIDVTHDVARHDVRGGGLALARAAQYLVPGVVLGVVDPGVGTDRRPIALEVGDGQSVLVGPDNGLLAPAVALVGGASRAVVLDNPDYWLETPGSTFDGRDLFGPCAAHLCMGVELDRLGTEIDPATLTPGVIPVGGRDGDAVVGEVLWVDHFGNAQLNLDPDDLAGLDGPLMLTTGDTVRTVQRVESYAEIAPGAVGLLVDSHGLLSLAVAGGSAALDLRVDESDRVRLEVADQDVGQTTRVQLGKREQ
ncbi:MAG: SAM hydrolase/SAM-dependent halogenase family protein [Acidimicrobiales bacterium]